MRNVNLTHGSLYLLGAYIGYEVAGRTGFWLLGVAAGFVAVGLVGLVYFPTYGIVLTFVIMVATLAIRAQGIMGGRT